MEQLIQLVSEKAGISSEQATNAVATVSDYLKTKFPDALDKQLDSALSGNNVEETSLFNSLTSKAIETFVGAKDKTTEVLGDAKEMAEGAFEDAKEKAQDVLGSVKSKLSGLFGGDK